MSRPHVVRRLIADKTKLADELSDPAMLSAFHQIMLTMSGINRTPSLRDTQQFVAKWQRSLAVAEDFAVTRDLCAVLTQAAVDLPDEYIVEHHHLFAEHGLIWLEQPLSDEVHGDAIALLTWHHGTGWSERKPGGPGMMAGLEVNIWGRNFQGYLLPIGSDFLPYGLPSDGWSAIVDVDYKLSLATRFVLAMQMFMRQELPAIGRYPAPRSYRPLMRRLEWPERQVTVIDLRKRKYARDPDAGGESGRSVSVRHVVRGHWHAYWVGRSHPLHSGLTDDKEKVHVYVHAFLRGPEDGPLAMTDRIHVVRR